MDNQLDLLGDFFGNQPNHTWILNKIIRKNIAKDVSKHKITLGYTNGRLFGKGVCNRYFAGVEFVENELRIGPIGSTRMACEIGGDVESLYFQSLSEINRIEKICDGIVLGKSDNTLRLVFYPFES